MTGSRYIWDWERKQRLLERRTQPGAPPSTYGVVWSAFEPDRCVCARACVCICMYVCCCVVGCTERIAKTLQPK